jgi:hypothetical protein
MAMANAYPFFAFCSAVLNDPATRFAYNTADMQDALVATYGLTASQAAAVKKRDTAKILAELEKELKKATEVRDIKQSKAFLCW